MLSPWTRARLGRLVVWLVGLLVVLASVAVVYGATPLPAEEARLDAVRANPAVAVEERPGGYVLRDAGDEDAPAGLVFYPGGRVDPAAYLWTLAPLVERTDVRVFVPRMPLNLAVLDPGAASGVMARNPEIETWYVGGHSLGGAMACRYAGNHPGRVEGVVLLAAYCEERASPRDPLLAVTGTRDGVLDRERFAAFRASAGDAAFVELAGVNHSQFGAYGGQPGDGTATTSDRVARRRLAAALVEWFGNRTAASDAGATARDAPTPRAEPLSSRSSAAAPASPRTGRPSSA